MRPPAFCAIMLAASATAASATFDSLSEGDTINGFRAVALYLDAADHPFGARFRHVNTGFVLDLIQLQSVPQAFIYVNTYPTSDKGEPHTQEHLLVGKGNKGRMLSESDGMTLTGSTAFTKQWRTCYPFNTQAGTPVFYQQFERYLDALLHPDYSDEEIRREVRNFGVTEDATTHQLRLEEKGTVYNEMESTSRQQISVLYRSLFRTIYGPNHPLSFNSGGEPSGIREMLPADIRKFHREHYFLANMGSVVSLPRVNPSIRHSRSSPDSRSSRASTRPLASTNRRHAPSARPAPAHAISIYDYPAQNDNSRIYCACLASRPQLRPARGNSFQSLSWITFPAARIQIFTACSLTVKRVSFRSGSNRSIQSCRLGSGTRRAGWPESGCRP